MDLAYGVMCLEAAGIKPENIFIYVDGFDRADIAQWIALGTTHPYEIHRSAEFFVHQAANKHENLVMFVTGHGSLEGIDASKPISPFDLVSCLKNSPGLGHAVVYLGQCFAGTFNYIGAGRKQRAVDGQQDADVILVGATNLHPSISSSTKEQFLVGEHNWVANLFLLHVFKWFSNPVDVDGDSHTTIIDSYKYAGVQSNSSNKDAKGTALIRCIDLHGKWAAAKLALNNNTDPQLHEKLRIDLQGFAEMYEHELLIHSNHQEPWILNAIPAQFLRA